MSTPPTVSVVVPTLGRASLPQLLDRLAEVPCVYLVDDRRGAAGSLLPQARPNVTELPGRAAGPAAARNVGWRAASTEWVAFLDDDVLPPETWYPALLADLVACEPDVAGCSGRIVVPLPADRRPTDWERNVAGLRYARWATADLAYRRSVLAEVSGFDERFPRAYREDADLGLRVTATGYRIVPGKRHVEHPVRPAGPWISVRLQRGNADDPLMRRLHGADWRVRAGVPAGRRPWHLATASAVAVALVGMATRRRRLAWVGGTSYVLLTGDFAWRRIAPGPRTPAEIATMLSTSAVLPLAASWYWLAGIPRARRIG